MAKCDQLVSTLLVHLQIEDLHVHWRLQELVVILCDGEGFPTAQRMSVHIAEGKRSTTSFECFSSFGEVAMIKVKMKIIPANGIREHEPPCRGPIFMDFRNSHKHHGSRKEF